jgi:hypothetical protein
LLTGCLTRNTLFAPVRLATDGNGRAGFVLFLGTNSGVVRLTAGDSAAANAAAGNRSTAQATIFIGKGSWRSSIPSRWPTKAYTNGRAKIQILSLPQVVYYASHGQATKSGLTYNGLPYLPNDPNLFNEFESSCLQAVQGQ